MAAICETRTQIRNTRANEATAVVGGIWVTRTDA